MAEEQAKFTPVPMFLPTDTRGESVATVMTREKFIHENIATWLQWRAGKAGAIVLGVMALFALGFNTIIAAGLGLAAGYCYGTYSWNDFKINRLLKNRYLLEST